MSRLCAIDPNFADTLSLDASQRDALESFRSVPAGLGILQAPPATGKTQTIVQCAKPFVQHSKEVGTVLGTCFSNQGTDRLAEAFQVLIDDMIEKESIPKTTHALRLHAFAIEDSILEADANQQCLESAQNVRPHNITEEADRLTSSKAKMYTRPSS